MVLTIMEISKENHASRIVKILNHGSRYYAESRLRRIVWARSRITLIIWVPSCVTENPFATLSLETPATYSDGHFKGWREGGINNFILFPVWLVTNRKLYYPLHQDDYLKRRQTKGTNPDVCLWETDITNSDNLMVEDHPKFRGVCVVQLKKVVEN